MQIDRNNYPTLVLAYVYPTDSNVINQFDEEGKSAKGEFYTSALFVTQEQASQWTETLEQHSQWKAPKFLTVPGFCSGCCTDGEWFHILAPGEHVGFVFQGEEGKDETVEMYCDYALWNLAEVDASYKMPLIVPHKHSLGWKNYHRIAEICEAGEQCQKTDAYTDDVADSASAVLAELPF